MDYDSDEVKELEDVNKLESTLEADKHSLNKHIANSFTMTSNRLEQISKLESALKLNEMTTNKLTQLKNMLINRLSECRQKLNEIRSLLPNDKQVIFRYISCGKPYFKDQLRFPAPQNVDTIVMTKLQMYDFSNVMPVKGWTIKDKRDFIYLIENMSKDIKIKELVSKIARLRRIYGEENCEQLKTEITTIKKEINLIKEMSIKNLALPLDQEYDWDLVANKLNGRHSAEEYRSLWKMFLHPSINKNLWSKEEHRNLKYISENNDLQDWDTIANQLNMGRSAYQCFVYYRTNLCRSFAIQKWTKDEEEYLKRLIEHHQEGNYIPWAKVAAMMENRTKMQIYNKYLTLMEQRKGRFLPEEDSVILTCIEKFGPNFNMIAKYLIGRSVIQTRRRYHLLSNTVVSAVWTVAEDRQLIQLMANQEFYPNYSDITKYFPGKDRSQLRARYTVLMKWMLANPYKDLARAPRRNARYLHHGRTSNNLNEAIVKLNERIKFEIENKVTKRSSLDTIEQHIIAILSKENYLNELNKNSEDQRLYNMQIDSLNNIKNLIDLGKILTLLRARLNKMLFRESPYFECFSRLIDEDFFVDFSYTIKTYSKKGNITNIVKPIDMWGKTLGPVQYVLPLNYSTITGCRKLMAYISTLSNDTEQPLNIDMLLESNIVFNEQVSHLTQCFHSLFLWPLLLSNKNPYINNKIITSTSEFKLYGENQSGVAIPELKKQKITNNEIINLDDSNNNKNRVTLTETIVGNDDVLYIDLC